MAIQRQYEQPSLNVPDQRQVAQTRVAGPGASGGPLAAGDSEWQSRLLQGLGQNIAGTLNQLADLELSSRYLEGQAKAGIIESEDAIQGNPLTRDWEVAGYRDTMGKLALADMEAQLLVDMPELRTKPPEEMEVYLAQRRSGMLPALNSMSREARATAVGQMLLQDRAAVKKYTTEHMKYTIDQRMQGLSTKFNTSLTAFKAVQADVLNGGPGSAEAFNEQLRSTSADGVAVWFDPALPQDVKVGLTVQMLQSALTNDAIQLYEKMGDTRVPDGQGGESTLLDRLPVEERTKLDNAYREARNRTSAERNFALVGEIDIMEHSIRTGAYLGSMESLNATLYSAMRNGAISESRASALRELYLKSREAGESTTYLSGELAAGNPYAVYAAGKTPKQVVDGTVEDMLKQGKQPVEIVNRMVSIGNGGAPEGYSKAGELFGYALSNILLSKDGEVSEAARQTFTTIDGALRSLGEDGLDTRRSQLLAGMSGDDRIAAAHIFRKVDAGNTFDQAVQSVRSLIADTKGASLSERAGAVAAKATDVNKAIAGLDVGGRAWVVANSIAGTVFADSRAEGITRPKNFVGDKDGWWSDTTTVDFYRERYRNAIGNEVNEVLMENRWATVEEALTVAKANVAARTVKSDLGGPVYFPSGVNLGTLFKDSAGQPIGPANVPALGAAIDNVLRSHKSGRKDTRFQLSYANGRLLYQEYAGNEPVGAGGFIETEIADQVRKDITAKQKKNSEVYGSGKTVKVGDVAVRFNGDNSAGVPSAWMFGFRENLIAHEGVASGIKPDVGGRKHKDGKPVMTGGAGVSSTNTFFPKPGPDGKLTPEQVQTSFVQASDAAAKIGADVARHVGRENAAGFQLFAELAYQSGTAFATRKDSVGDEYRALMNAMQGTDVEAAKQAMRSTAAYKASGDKNKRRATYLTLVEQSMRGR